LYKYIDLFIFQHIGTKKIRNRGRSTEDTTFAKNEDNSKKTFSYQI